MYASKRGQQHLRENKKQKTSKLLGSRGTGVTFDYIHILNTSFIYNILTYICTCMCVIFCNFGFFVSFNMHSNENCTTTGKM